MLVFDAVLPAGVTGRIRGQIIMQILFLVNIFPSYLKESNTRKSGRESQ